MVPVMRNFILAIFVFGSFVLFGQGVNTPFGQNRLPFNKMEWEVLSSEEIDAFYYEGGANLAAYAQLVAAENIIAVEDFLNYRLGGRLEIIVFNSIEDLRESNTGLKEQLFNLGGYTYVVDNKVIAYFNGSHKDFERQLKEGIAEIILSEMVYGNSLQERVQSSSLLFLPSWFFKGLTAYMANTWDTETDSKVRDAVLSGKFINFNLLNEEDAILAGHSIWNYIAQKYGAKNIPEIVYLTRISKGYEGAFGYALGINSGQLIEDWLAFYREKYKESEADRTLPRKLLNIPEKVSSYPHTELKTHPNGKKVAFVVNKNGHWQVKVYDKREKKENTLLRGGKREGYQVINYSYPILAWEQKGTHLGVLYYENGKTLLKKITLAGKVFEKYTLPNNIDQVLSFDFADENTLILSAIKNGQSDLYLYNLTSGDAEQLTDDIFDDLWPRFNTEQSKIIFSSNRPYDSLHIRGNYFKTTTADNNFDVFEYNYAYKSNRLKRITNTPFVNEIRPVFYLPGYYSFVSDVSGIYNAYASKDTLFSVYSRAILQWANGKTDTINTTRIEKKTNQSIIINGTEYTIGDSLLAITAEQKNAPGLLYFPLTNYKRNILGRDMASTDDAEYNLVMYNNQYQIFETNVSDQVETDAKFINIVPTEYRLATKVPFFYGETLPETVIITDTVEEPIQIEKGNYIIVPKDSLIQEPADTLSVYFQTDYPEDYILNTRGSRNRLENEPKTGSRKNFFTAMFPDYYVSQLDNSILNTYYHLNNGGNGPSLFANMNVVLQVKTTLTDLLGNHRIIGGVRMPFSLNGSDYFVEYQNKKNKINWDLAYFRLSRRNDGERANRQLINQFSATAKLPFNEITSFRIHGIGRQDKNIELGTDSASLKLQDKKFTWAGTKLELVVDNTKNIDINLPFGTRFKIFAEFYQNTENTDVRIINLGLDFRKYIKLHNKIIWASRLVANSSVGASKVQYLLGGIENWIGPSYDGYVARGQGAEYVFQSLANSMRGFKQNIRNGTNYVLFNTEIRIPVANYITQKPVRADYLRNFMIVPFFDLGAAWYGTSPWDAQPYNTSVIEGGGYVVTVTNADSPIVGSTGLGARTRLFGYYIKADYAFSFLNGRYYQNMLQFSVGYDF